MVVATFKPHVRLPLSSRGHRSRFFSSGIQDLVQPGFLHRFTLRETSKSPAAWGGMVYPVVFELAIESLLLPSRRLSYPCFQFAQ